MKSPPHYCTSFWRRLAFRLACWTTRDFEYRCEHASLNEMIGCRQTLVDRIVNFALYDPRKPQYEDWLADDVDRGVAVHSRDLGRFKTDDDYRKYLRKVSEDYVYSLPAHKRFRVLFTGFGRRRWHWTD